MTLIVEVVCGIGGYSELETLYRCKSVYHSEYKQSQRISHSRSSKMATIGTSTAETIWPSCTPVSDEKKKLLAYYFSLLDTNEATTGKQIAEIFTDDGCMISQAGKVHGSERTSKFIDNYAELSKMFPRGPG